MTKTGFTRSALRGFLEEASEARREGDHAAADAAELAAMTALRAQLAGQTAKAAA